MAIVTIPAALRQLIDDRDRDLLDHPDRDEAVALMIEDMIQVMLDQTGIEVAQLCDRGSARRPGLCPSGARLARGRAEMDSQQETQPRTAAGAACRTRTMNSGSGSIHSATSRAKS